MTRSIRVILVLAVAGLAFLLAGSCRRGRDSKQEIAEESTEGIATKSVPSDMEQLRDGFRPLTASEVNLYLEVLRATAERCRTLKPAYKAAIAEQERQLKNVEDWQKSGHIPTDAQARAVSDAGERIAKLTLVDDLVTEERHIDKERYQAIKTPVERAAFPAMGEVGEGEESQHTAEEAKKWKTYENVMEANKKAVAPYLSEMGKLHSIVEAYKRLAN